jgi:hypothetical protein
VATSSHLRLHRLGSCSISRTNQPAILPVFVQTKGLFSLEQRRELFGGSFGWPQHGFQIAQVGCGRNRVISNQRTQHRRPALQVCENKPLHGLLQNS